MKKILAIDGNSILFRAFYGVRPLVTKTGKNTNAIFGMLNMLSSQLEAVKPDYVVVAFDRPEPTFRHKLYPEYKAGRRETPAELLEQMAYANRILPLLGLNVLTLPGYEADDIQGTVARFAHTEEGLESFVFSGDRDLLQLIDEKTTVLLAGNSATVPMHRDEFFAKYGIEPSQFIDMKALMGDSSDNIPGVAGIGEKTASALLQAYGTLDGVYDAAKNTPDDKRIGKSAREKLLKNEENAYFSKTLATIKTDVPLGLTLEDLKRKEIDRKGLYQALNELELQTFIRKFGLSAADLAENSIQAVSKTESKSSENSAISSEAESSGLSAEAALPEAEVIGADRAASLLGKRIAIAFASDGIRLSDGEKEYLVRGSLADLSDALRNAEEIICFEGKAFWHKCREAKIDLSHAKLLDLALYGYVINPESGSGTLSSLLGSFAGMTVTDDAPSALGMAKAEPVMRKKIEDDGEIAVLDELELPLLPVLAEIEDRGFMVDREGLRDFGRALDDLAKDLQERIFMQAGREFNINSPKQLGEVLYVDLGLPQVGKKTKNGFSTNAETLEELRVYSPIIDDILEYRQVQKLNGTYAAVLPEVADAEGRIHTELKQTATATGRLSSADPNLQNIPIRTKMGREMRRFFVAKEGYELVDADYSQIELRLLAHISGDEAMQNAFRSGEDIHRKTAAAVFGIPEERVTDDLRKAAKAVNFGIVYGISGFSLAKDIGTSVPVATKYIKSYLERYPKIGEYLEKVVAEAKEKGYCTTPMGRRRYIPELSAQNAILRAFGKRVAMNAPIQGAAADIMKLAMIRTDARLKKEGIDAAIVMQVHDELVVETKREQVPLCKKILAEEMENAVSLSIPLTVDVTSGKNWLEQE